MAAFTPDVDQYVELGETITFDGSTSRASGGVPRFEWRTTGAADVVSRGSTYSRSFDAPGRVGVELTVIDTKGQIAKKHINVWVTGNRAPVADFDPGKEQRIDVGETIAFDGSKSNDPDGGPLSYQWRTTGLSGVVSDKSGYSRTFDKPGRFGVELVVTDRAGGSARKHINVWVTGNEAPIAAFTPGKDQQIKVGETLNFDGSESRDPDGGDLIFQWRTTGIPRVVSDTNRYGRTFSAPGRFGVELTVIDDTGAYARKHINVWVTAA